MRDQIFSGRFVWLWHVAPRIIDSLSSNSIRHYRNVTLNVITYDFYVGSVNFCFKMLLLTTAKTFMKVQTENTWPKVLPIVNHSGNRIRAAVTEMDSGITKPDSGNARGQVHRTSSLNIITVCNCSIKVFFSHATTVLTTRWLLHSVLLNYSNVDNTFTIGT